MPNYDYQCQKCQHKFEVFQSIKAARIKKCPKCGGEVKRLIGAGGGFIFKGSGFYATDYKKRDAKSKKAESLDKKSSDSCKTCKDDTCKFKES